jgi:hypothetical protein
MEFTKVFFMDSESACVHETSPERILNNFATECHIMLSLVNFLSLLSCGVNDFTEDMATFTTLVKITK